MPTGYTAAIVDGKITDFPTFAMQCARAFGALISMRDDAWDAVIPQKFDPDLYYAEKLIEAKNQLEALQQMTMLEAISACEKEYAEQVAERDKYKRRLRIENQRLQDMIAKVKAWDPPSANHTEMKKFMLDQLKISLNDIDDSRINEIFSVRKVEAREWLNNKINNLHNDIGRYAAEYEKDVERAKGRTLWIQQLRDSLK